MSAQNEGFVALIGKVEQCNRGKTDENCHVVQAVEDSDRR